MPQDKCPYSWLYANVRPAYGLWLYSAETLVKVGLVLVIVAAGPQHPLVAFTVPAVVVAGAMVFVQEKRPLLENSSNHSGKMVLGSFTDGASSLGDVGTPATLICAGLVAMLTFGSMAAIAKSSSVPGGLAAFVCFCCLILMVYFVVPWRFVHKRYLKRAELDVSTVQGMAWLLPGGHAHSRCCCST